MEFKIVFKSNFFVVVEIIPFYGIVGELNPN